MSNSKKYTYEIVEEAENPLETKFIKKNVEVEFNMQQMLDYENAADRQVIEMIGKIDIEDAKMKNVEDYHDDAIALVRDLDPVKQQAILIWLKSKEIVDALCPKRDELKKAIQEHKDEIKVIKEQTGWEPYNEKENDESDKEGAKEVSAEPESGVEETGDSSEK